jgi:hypothetical protein
MDHVLAEVPWRIPHTFTSCAGAQRDGPTVRSAAGLTNVHSGRAGVHEDAVEQGSDFS